MVIREAQISEFKEHGQRAFEEELAAHLTAFAPELCRILGPDSLRDQVRVGLARAREYGFTYRGPARFFLELMFSFGSSFDTDPQLPWAAAALRSAGDQMSRAEQLYGAMQEYLHEVAGPANEYATAALRRFKELQNSQAPQQRDAQLLARYLRASYPEKYDYVGDRAIQALVQRASAAARERALPPHAVDFLTGMMFGFGYGVLDDPLYAWVRRTLDDPLATTPDAKLERLRAKVRVYVDAMLSRPPAAPLSNA